MLLLDQVVRGRVSSDHLLRDARRRRAGAVRLDVTPACARPLARHAVLDDHHVPELGPRVEELPGEDDPAADPGAERERPEVRRAPSRPVRMLGVRRAARVVLDADRQVEPLVHLRDEVDLAQRDVDRAERVPRAVVETRRDPEPDGVDPVERQLADGGREAVEQRVLRRRRGRMLDGLQHASVLDHPRQDLRPAEVDADDAVARSYPAGNLPRRMAPDEKPYRVYRGGRAKGKVPTTPRPGRQQSAAAGRRGDAGRRWSALRVPRAGRPAHRRQAALGPPDRARARWWCSCWSSSGRSRAGSRSRAASPTRTSASTRTRRPRSTHQSGLLLSHSTTILMLGTDNNAKLASRAGDMHSDSILLLRTDPSHHRLYYLSIPRDLQVPIPGSSTQKINAAFQIGGAALAIKTIRQFTGLDDQPRDGRQLRRLQGPDRRARRDHGQRAEADPLEPLRLPVREPGALRPVAGLALPQGLAAHERRARADLLAHPREPARPVGDRRHARRAPAGRDGRDRREVHVDRDADRSAVRRQLAREAADDRPDREPARRSSAG